MWLNEKQVSDTAIANYRQFLLRTRPNYIVIDGLFNEAKLDEVVGVLQQPDQWKTQQHTYSALYVDNAQWQNTRQNERFVQRDVWQRGTESCGDSCGDREPDSESDKKSNEVSANVNVAQEFLLFLRGDEFMSLLSRMFAVPLTDMNVAEPSINTNYFRLAPTDFVEQHADDSPGREVCMLLYLNKDWSSKAGGELSFLGANAKTSVEKGLDKDSHNSITIAPLYNRCVLFDPSSTGSEHWVEKLHAEYADQYRYNVTSWYWAE
jgi:Rps23 Pro-64 3,4-dihydroxylase Tpa1-like proline 4-hydroxylase